MCSVRCVRVYGGIHCIHAAEKYGAVVSSTAFEYKNVYHGISFWMSSLLYWLELSLSLSHARSVHARASLCRKYLHCSRQWWNGNRLTELKKLVRRCVRSVDESSSSLVFQNIYSKDGYIQRPVSLSILLSVQPFFSFIHSFHFILWYNL